ncbi:MAG TPA: YIP1 family protein [Pyrinomonadaceae bacterium]
MRRIAGVIIFAFGLLLLLGDLLLHFRGLKNLGFFGMFIGAVVFGLSFIRRPALGPDAPAPLPVADRVTRVFYEPEPVFKNLRYHPRWLAGFLVLAFFGVTYQVALTQRLGVERFAEDEANRRIEGGFVPLDKISADDYRQAKIREAIGNATRAKVTTPLWVAGLAFIGILVLAGVYLLCVLAFGGRMNFWQAVSVAVYGSLPPAVISSVLSLFLLYVKQPDDVIPLEAQRHGLGRADLGLLFKATKPMSNTLEHPVLYTLTSFIGLFQLYGWWVTVNGLKHAGGKLSGGSAWAIALILWLFGMLLTSALALLAPTLIS